MKKYTLFVLIYLFVLALITSCGGGGGGGGAVSFSHSNQLHNGGDAGGWGNGNQTGGGLGGGSASTISAEAGTFTPCDDIDWTTITLEITVTSDGATTTHTFDSGDKNAIAELLTSLKKGDTVSVSVEIEMEDSSTRTSSAGPITIGVGDNHISIPTPYKFECSTESCVNAYESYGCTDSPSATLISGENSGIYTVNDAASKLPSADDIEAPGYIFDHWETIDGQPYTPGVSRGDVTIVPVMKPDYTCAYGDLVDNIVITNQQEFNDLMSIHADQDFDGKEIKLYCNVSTSTSFSKSTNATDGFKGTFDGQGHTVQLSVGYITSQNINNVNHYYSGLFAINQGTIKSVKVTGTVNGTGGENGYVGGIAAVNKGTIENCANAARTDGTARNNGGIAGTNYSTINQCYNTGEIRSNATFEPEIGGIAGDNISSAVITNCYNKGTLWGVNSNSTRVGGIAGYYGGGSISNCYNTYNGNSYTSWTFGTLCGLAASGMTVTDFYCDTSKNLYGTGSAAVSGTPNPLTSAGNLVTANPSIWQAGSPYPTLVNAPY